MLWCDRFKRVTETLIATYYKWYKDEEKIVSNLDNKLLPVSFKPDLIE